MDIDVEHLTREESLSALRFLLARMDQETRGELMACLPVTYGRLYPKVDSDIILAKVRGRLAPGGPR